MKLVHFIFAIYIAALSVYPCYDECTDASCSADKEVRGQPHDEDGDVCSPFCLSTCCAVHILSQGAVEYVAVVRNTMVDDSAYQLALMPSVVLSIWQPPKLA